MAVRVKQEDSPPAQRGIGQHPAPAAHMQPDPVLNPQYGRHEDHFFARQGRQQGDNAQLPPLPVQRSEMQRYDQQPQWLMHPEWAHQEAPPPMPVQYIQVPREHLPQSYHHALPRPVETLQAQQQSRQMQPRPPPAQPVSAAWPQTSRQDASQQRGDWQSSERQRQLVPGLGEGPAEGGTRSDLSARHEQPQPRPHALMCSGCWKNGLWDCDIHEQAMRGLDCCQHCSARKMETPGWTCDFTSTNIMNETGGDARHMSDAEIGERQPEIWRKVLVKKAARVFNRVKRSQYALVKYIMSRKRWQFPWFRGDHKGFRELSDAQMKADVTIYINGLALQALRTTSEELDLIDRLVQEGLPLSQQMLPPQHTPTYGQQGQSYPRNGLEQQPSAIFDQHFDTPGMDRVQQLQAEKDALRAENEILWRRVAGLEANRNGTESTTAAFDNGMVNFDADTLASHRQQRDGFLEALSRQRESRSRSPSPHSQALHPDVSHANGSRGTESQTSRQPQQNDRRQKHRGGKTEDKAGSYAGISKPKHGKKGKKGKKSTKS